jgi:osmotically-inducible protein OsmY
MMSDIELRQNVLDELEFEPSIDAAHIGVTVDGGVVTLTGHVSSYAEKIAAEEAVRRVKGVRAIAEEIEVRYPGHKQTSDDEIAKRALNILQWDVLVPYENISLTVHKGLVTLTGQVQWYFQKTSAENAIRKLSGVTGVVNDITVKSAAKVADVKSKIEDALKRHAEVEAKGVRVTVLNDKVTLDGEVASWGEKWAVKSAAWSVPGVRFVEDNLSIGKW